MANVMPSVPGLRVVHSSIHGYGCVATRDFAPGEVIADVDGVPYRFAEIADGDDDYCLWIHDDMYFDMVDQTRWINHSCAPNAAVEGEEEADGRVWARIVCVKPIRAGEEITYDYAFAAHLAIPCRCGAPTCRGWIVDEDEMELLEARRRASA
jgi:hypothetical protein